MDAWASTSAKQADIISVSHNGQMQQPIRQASGGKPGAFFVRKRGERNIQRYIWKSERSSKKRQVSDIENRYTRISVNKT